MKTYKVYGHVAVSCWTEVEANSPEEAIKLAGHRDLAEHSIDGTYEDTECWHFDNDGSPANLYAEESK